MFKNMANMLDKIINIKDKYRFKNALDSCCEALLNHKIIAVPTDTIYGIACLANSSEAIKKLYEIKKRDKLKPLAICVYNISEIPKYSNISQNLNLNDFLPGPFTLIFKKKIHTLKYLNPERDDLAVRIPNNLFIHSLSEAIREYGPLALSSANISDEQNALNINDFKTIHNEIEIIIDNGPINKLNYEGSTIIDLTIKNQYKIVRKGCAYMQAIQILKKYNMKECD